MMGGVEEKDAVQQGTIQIASKSSVSYINGSHILHSTPLLTSFKSFSAGK